jgi:hypothetical protein
MTKVTILHVRDCPNLAAVRERLDAVLAQRGDVEVEVRLIQTQDAAELEGMAGSPTVLIDGIDPFAEPGQSPSVSCRIYRDDAGCISGAPSLAQLRHVLTTDLTGHTAQHGKAAPLAIPASCCVPASRALVGLVAALESHAASDPAEQAIHQAILHTFAATGQPPSVAALEPIAAGHGASAADVLSRLHATDAIGLDAAGQIAVAYPFSAASTRHRVALANGVTVSAMCAIDALGMPAMLDTDAVVTSADPLTGHLVTVTVQRGEYTWAPATAVVFVSSNAGEGPLAETCCGDLNFFTTVDTARTWKTAHSQVPGEILDPAAAEDLGRALFGRLLANHDVPDGVASCPSDAT